MNAFETMIAQYNATLPTVTDGQVENLQLTERGILMVTMRDTDGSDVIVSGGDDVSGTADKGFISYGIDTNNLAQPLRVDANGNLQVIIPDGIEVNVDLTPGLAKDVGTDELGANPEPGVVAGITGSYQVIAQAYIPQGETWVVNEFDASCDSLGQFQLVVGATGTAVTSIIRTMLIPENQGTNQLVFPRGREILAADDITYVKVIGKSLRSKSMSAAAGINMYKKEIA
jgi:hypothetical protein